MDSHLSALQIDELAAGLASTSNAGAHAASCEVCGGKVAAAKRAREDFFAQPGVQSRKAVFLASTQQAPPTSRPRWLFALVPALVAAAFLVLVPLRAMRPPQSDEVSLKGSFAVSHRGELKVGGLVEIVLSNPAPAFVTVVALDERGSRAVLWPSAPTDSARVEAGAAVALAPTFEVTPGNMWLVAIRSPTQLTPAQAVAAITPALDGGTPTVHGRSIEASADFLKVSP